MRLSLKTVNDELSRLGQTAQLVKAKNYFYFQGGDSEDWLERSVGVRTLNSLTLKQWVQEFRRLRELNQQILHTMKPKK